MLYALCKHCQRPITYTRGDNGIWFEETDDKMQMAKQYCWIDPIAGSKLHEPDTDSIIEKQKRSN